VGEIRRNEQMNDVMRLAIDKACMSFGGTDGMFSAAGFASAIRKMSDTEGLLDGNVVRLLLTGRNDVIPLHDGCHYKRLIEK
jgi:hypothetical protein